MNDLLYAVKGADAASPSRPPAASAYGDVELGRGPGAGPTPPPAPASEKAKEMDLFFAKVEDVKADMAEIKTRQREIQQMHERSKTIVRQKEMQRHREDMQVR